MDLAAQFNTGQAGAVILKKIDPLQRPAAAELANFIALQKAATRAATDGANRATTQRVGILASAGVLLLVLTARVSAFSA